MDAHTTTTLILAMLAVSCIVNIVVTLSSHIDKR